MSYKVTIVWTEKSKPVEVHEEVQCVYAHSALILSFGKGETEQVFIPWHRIARITTVEKAPNKPVAKTSPKKGVKTAPEEPEGVEEDL